MKLLLLAVLSGFAIGIQSDAPMPLTGIVRNIRGGGAPIPAATVIVTNNRTGVRTEVKTAADGTFVVPGAQPGTYRIVIGAAGFQPLVTYDFCVVPGKPPVFSAGLGPDRVIRSPSNSSKRCRRNAAPRVSAHHPCRRLEV